MSSTKTRLSLRARCFARVSTCFAILARRVTLRRTCLAEADFVRVRFASGMAPCYTILVQALCSFWFVKRPRNWRSWNPTFAHRTRKDGAPGGAALVTATRGYLAVPPRGWCRRRERSRFLTGLLAQFGMTRDWVGFFLNWTLTRSLAFAVLSASSGEAFRHE